MHVLLVINELIAGYWREFLVMKNISGGKCDASEREICLKVEKNEI